MPKIKTIRREGGSRIIAITNVIPIGWQVVAVVKTKQKGNTITVTFERVR